jgi:hypothetical protein
MISSCCSAFLTLEFRTVMAHLELMVLARTRRERSTGVGLAIVAALAVLLEAMACSSAVLEFCELGLIGLLLNVALGLQAQQFDLDT